jgi:uncharacterized protein (TIGR02145 family)
MTSDYNLRSNYHYTLNLTVNGTYIGADDTRGVEYRKDEIIDCTAMDLANCYMVHPAPAGSGITRTYRIPIQRINDYWTGTADGYGASTKNGTTYRNNPLTVGEAWSASVLWSDLAAITTSTPITASGNYTGVRSKDYFSFEVSAGTASGNFVVQVTDAANTILWSWHLWVTDYEADLWRDGAVNSVPSASYALFGGQVDSYNGTVWQSGGILGGKVMMDRNLGALEHVSAAISTSGRGQLYYQFGRKDPFPASLNGASTLLLNVLSPYPAPQIAKSVQAPTTFYTNTSGNWTSDAQGSDYLWNDPNVSKTSGAKSIYDPCPAGWRLPLDGTWYDFFSSVWQASPAGRMYNSSVFYVAAGSRLGSSGDLSNVKTNGYYWSATAYANMDGMSLIFSNSGVTTQSLQDKKNGYPVRCSQQ